MNSKGQIQQVFIYILAIIIVGLILLIGYKAINGMIQKSCDVQKTNFQTDIRVMIDRYNDYGSTHVKEINTPCGYFQVCFVDSEKIGEPITTSNTIIKNSVHDNVSQNIFMMKADITEPIGYDEKIQVEGGIICINSSSGKFNIKFTGLGKKVRISLGE